MATPADVLEYIVNHKIGNNGNSPSLDNIKDEFGISKSSAKYILDKLKKEGYITGEGVKNIMIPNSEWRER